jgi:hypothetical protein
MMMDIINTNSPSIKVAIVDDYKIIVEGLEILTNESGIAQITGKAYGIKNSWLKTY